MRILFGIPTKSHVEITLDELYGLNELGYVCDQFEYGGKKKFKSAILRFFVIFLNALKLVSKIYKFKPDFIYLNSRVEFIASARDFITILMVRLLYLQKVHFVIKSHGSNLEVLQTERFFFKRMVFPFLKRSIRGWLFLSSEEINWITTHNLLDSNKIYLTKNIVRAHKFQIDTNFKQQLNIQNDYKIILFVGRVVKEKGLNYLVEAFAKVLNNHKMVLIIIGDGAELRTIKNKINKLKLDKNVISTGWISEDKVTTYISNSDILVYPTFAPEGFPMALFNSIAAGLPIITTYIRAAMDYLQEPNNCLWVKPKCSDSIEVAMEKLLTNEDLMQQMRENNLQKAKLFAKSVVSHELADILISINVNSYNSTFREVRK